MKKLITLSALLLICLWGHAQEEHPKLPEGVKESEYHYRKALPQAEVQARVEPPHWYTGMARPELQLLIHDQNIKACAPVINYPGITVREVHTVENPNYLFIDLLITEAAQPGSFEIKLCDSERTYTYELKARDTRPGLRQGLTSQDLIYLIMPDRFANGDPSNDSLEDMAQTGIDRSNVFFRHGGDLLGLMEHLDYLQELGVTAIWLNPVLENDQPYESYHGYAVTDLYKIDPRLGTNEQYKQLVELCHERGIKVVMDIIHNHVGDRHWFIEDLPSEDWIHQFDSYTRSNFRDPALVDPHASEADKKQLSEGWFDKHMPDLNQKHPLLATYLIQNNIWWNEFSGHDAYRIDTYFYPDQQFMSDWGKRMQEEYDDFNYFGETWVQGKALQARFTENSGVKSDINTYLPALTDYQLYYGITQMLNNDNGWTTGLNNIYMTLAHDFLYEDANRNVIFVDNHDLSRFFSVAGEDLNKFKMGIGFLLTTRGTPMLNYGTEILMTGSGGAFGEAGRRDFPGGWEDDFLNKFDPGNHTAKESEAFSFVKKLANLRKESPALYEGKLMHFIPQNEVYVYFRYTDAEKFMVVINGKQEAQELELKRFAEMLEGSKRAVDVISGEEVSLEDRLSLSASSILILKVK